MFTGAVPSPKPASDRLLGVCWYLYVVFIFLFEVTTTLMVLGYRALCFQVCCIVFRHIVADVQACTLLFIGPDSFVCTPSDLVTFFTFDFIVLVILI